MKFARVLLLAAMLALVGCASNSGDEPTAEDIGARLQSEYAGASLAIFSSRNGSPTQGIADPASKSTFYTWQAGNPGDDDYCQLAVRVQTGSDIIQQITVVRSGVNQIDTFWFFHHKYVNGCKAVK